MRQFAADSLPFIIHGCKYQMTNSCHMLLLASGDVSKLSLVYAVVNVIHLILQVK